MKKYFDSIQLQGLKNYTADSKTDFKTSEVKHVKSKAAVSHG